ncbi:hypothetical protein V1478_013472 [Vespula squamosa]|uniref:Uncharacterized protein n=1 Tax=Vespula squamosa TaxID=30214 RepID=A0ABD2ABN6_VESSQ
MEKRHEIRALRRLASNRDRLSHPKSGKEKERKLLVESFHESLSPSFGAGRGTTADQVSPNNASAVVTGRCGAGRKRGEPEGPLLGSYGIGKTYDSANEIQNATSQ